MKKILFLFFLIPSLSQALLVESPDSGIGGNVRMQDFPAITSLRQAMELKPAELTPIRESVAFTDSGRMNIRAVNLLFKGEYAKAIPDLEIAAGGDYTLSTHGNLALANELIGDYKKALEAASSQNGYISRKKPKPPLISIAVLNAKIKAGKSGDFAGPLLAIPETVRLNDLIHVDQQNPWPREPIQESFQASEVKKMLFQDLKSRLLFYKGKDPYVADLLYSYAVLEANLGSPTTAIDVLKMAGEYGFKDQALLQAQQERFQKLALLRTIRFTAITLLSLGAFLGLLYLIHRRKWHWSVMVRSKAYWNSQREERQPSKPQYHELDRF